MNDIRKFAEKAKQEAGLNSIVINDKEYTIQLLPARQSAMIGIEILKLIAPAWGAWMDSANKKDFILPEEDTMFTEVAILLVKQADSVDIGSIMEALTENVTLNGQKVDIDTEFRGNVVGLFALVKRALELNVGPFSQLPALLGLKTPSEVKKDKLAETEQ